MKRFFAYIRVSDSSQTDDSRKGEFRDGGSFTEQRTVIERYAQREGLTIIEWFREVETAAKQGRPIFTAMAKRLRKGEADGFIVHKVDRSSRNYHDWADINDLADAGFDVRFASDNLDLSTRGKRLLADVQAVFAADYIRNLKEEVRKGIDGRLKQGLLPWGAPLGYVDNGKRGKVKTICPVKGPLVRRAFELYATGTYSLTSLCKQLEAMGLRNCRGRRLSIDGLSAILKNPFYIGLIVHKKDGAVYKGVHEPLISTQLFDRVQAVISGKSLKMVKRNAFRYRRMFHCGECGRFLIGELQKGHIYYRCQNKACPMKCVREEVLDAAVERVYARLQLSEDERAALEAEVVTFLGDCEETTRRLQDAWKLQLVAIQARHDRLVDAYLEGSLDKETFERRKRGLLMEQCGLEEKLGSDVNSKEMEPRLREILELASTASLSHSMANDEEKREYLQIMTSNRSASRQNVVVEPSFPFCLLEKRQDLLKCGHIRNTTRSYPSSCEPARSANASPVLEPRHVIAEIYAWLSEHATVHFSVPRIMRRHQS